MNKNLPAIAVIVSSTVAVSLNDLEEKFV